jgi:hypothetical protein
MESDYGAFALALASELRRVLAQSQPGSADEDSMATKLGSAQGDLGRTGHGVGTQSCCKRPPPYLTYLDYSSTNDEGLGVKHVE